MKLARMRLEEARLRAGALDKGSEGELAALRDEVGELRRELGDVHERLDFAERLLSQSRELEASWPHGDLMGDGCLSPRAA